MSGPDANSTQIHGTCVAVDGRAAVFIGASGTGKSATALRMVASGARLVADDQVILTRKGDDIVATCPKGFAGLIEARGIGLLTVPHADTAIVDVIVDMEQTELHRLPPERKNEILGLMINIIYGRDNPVLEAGLMALLQTGRSEQVP